MKKPPVKTNIISVRLTDDQLARLTQTALAHDSTCSEWLRDLVHSATAPDPSLQTLTEEVIAVRLILQHIIAHILDQNIVTTDMLREACNTADREKKPRARALFPFNGKPQGESTQNVQ